MKKWAAYLVVFVCFLTYVTSFVDRLAWPPIMPLASKELGMNNTQAGSFMTAFYIGYVITQLPGGLLTDRFGYRRIISWSLVLLTATTVMMGFIQNYFSGMVAEFLMGISAGPMFSACIRAIYDWFPSKGRNTAMGVFYTGSSLGVTVVNLFVPTVANMFGWRAAFFAAGVFPLLCLILAFLWLKPRPLTTEEAALAAAKKPVTFLQDIKTLLANRNLLIVCAVGFGAMSSALGTKIWTNTLLIKGHGFSLVDAGMFMSLYGITAMGAKVIAGMLADYLKMPKKVLGFWLLICSVPVILWFSFNTNPMMFWLLTPLIGLFCSWIWPVLTAIGADVVEPRLIASGAGLSNAFWQMGTMASSISVGVVMDMTGSYSLGYASMAIAPAVGAFLLLLVKQPQKV